MQFYVNGYKPGDPFVQDAHPAVAQRPDGLPEEVDVLIIGCGPAGLVLAAQLANFPDIRTAVVDRRDGPLEVGQADGVACRTVAMFEAFGLADRLVNEAYWVNEVAFWRPDPDDRSRITHTGRIRDTEEGMSEFPHVIVNQARMLAYLLDHMERSASRLRPFYGLEASGVEVEAGGASVTLRHLASGGSSTIRAEYVVGCDGSRSAVRTAIGRELVGDATNESWGVMDVVAVTDFPDIRLKCTIYSAQGNIILIPREGGYLVRFYVALDEVSDREILESRSVTADKLAAVANRILHPAWRIYVFADRDGSRARRLCEFLASDASPVKRFTPAGADPDSVIDVRAVFQQGRRELAVDELPSVLLPRKGRFGLIDYEKVFCSADIFELRGVDRESGCMVVVRPDQYVAHVLPLDEHDRLADFFAGILIG